MVFISAPLAHVPVRLTRRRTCQDTVRNGPSPARASLPVAMPGALTRWPHSPELLAGRYASWRKTDVAFHGEVLGSGVNGKVLLGQYCDGQVAVKTLSKHHLPRSRQHEVANEVELFLSMDHPHIARLERVFHSGDDVHLVMEHLSGGELFDALRRKGRYEEAEAARCVLQMLLAVSHLHTRRVVHCDLKLENFILESADSEHLKLIDFGLAQRIKPGQKLTRSCGSIYYMAPEVLAE